MTTVTGEQAKNHAGRPNRHGQDNRIRALGQANHRNKLPNFVAMTDTPFDQDNPESSRQNLTRAISGAQESSPVGTRRHLPGWVRVLLALVAFEAAAFFPMLLSFIGPVKELLNSPDQVTVALTIMLALWPVSLAVYLALTFLLTRLCRSAAFAGRRPDFEPPGWDRHLSIPLFWHGHRFPPAWHHIDTG